jgi:hypothetical protein
MATSSNSDDFRQAAVEASASALRDRGHREDADPLQVGVSYCLPAPTNVRMLRTLIKAYVLIGLFSFLALFAIAGVMIFAGERWFGKDSSLPLAIGLPCGFVGWVMMFALQYGERALAKRALRKRLPEIWADPTQRPRIVRLENARTYNRPKIIADDFAGLLFHRESQCVQMEGLMHRYLIYAGDVVALHIVRAGFNEAVTVSYRAGGVQLDLTLIAFSWSLYSELSSVLQPAKDPGNLPVVAA